jgi:hypothetical protein
VNLNEAMLAIERLKTLLQQEQAVHREFRTEIYSDPEFKVIFARRERERSDRRTMEYLTKLLLEAADRAQQEEFHERSLAEIKRLELEDQNGVQNSK